MPWFCIKYTTTTMMCGASYVYFVVYGGKCDGADGGE